MARRLPAPAEIQRVRLDVDKAKTQQLDLAAAKCGLSLASFARLAVELLAEKGIATLDDVRVAADRLIAGSEPAVPETGPSDPPAVAKKPKMGGKK